MDRNDRIDWIKACATVTIPLIHAGLDLWEPTLSFDYVTRYSWTAFVVPAFVLMSGQLHRANGLPLGWDVIVRRLARVLVPYLVCCAVLYGTGVVPWVGPYRMAQAIVSGDTYGHFYFVPVIVFCILASWVFSRLSRGLLIGVLAVLVAYVLYLELLAPISLNMFRKLRDPFASFWLGYFLIGWLGLVELVAQRCPRTSMLAAFIAFVGLVVSVTSVPIRIIYAFACTALLWRHATVFPGMRLLSEASLAIYLWHYPLELLVYPYVTGRGGVPRMLGMWLLSLAGTVAGCLVARRVLGRERARFWLGA